MNKHINRQEIEAFGNLELLAKQVVEGFITGLHKSPFHGFSVEFAEHRLYNSGESTRHIDWKLAAKTEKLFVKRYEEETNLRCHIVIDHSSSMFFPKDAKTKNILNKFEFSIYTAASLIELLRRQRDAFGLSFFSDQLEFQSPVKSTMSHQGYLFSELEKRMNEKEIQKSTNAVESLHLLAESIHKRSLVIIFSDMLENTKSIDDVFSALLHLKHNKHEILLFHTIDKQFELDFKFENRPYTFVDMETGSEVKLHPFEVKENYISQMNALNKLIKEKCLQYKVDVIQADINEGFDKVLLEYLIKREKLN